MKYLETIKPTHRPPVDLADRVRHSFYYQEAAIQTRCISL
jgi:hypothetical protein